MKHIILLLAFTAGLLACDKDEAKKSAAPLMITPAPLSVEGFVPTANLTDFGCAYQKDYLSWYLKNYLANVTVQAETCSDAKNRDYQFPEGLELADGRCIADSCSVYEFRLKKDGRVDKFMSLLSIKGERTFGIITELKEVDYIVYVSNRPFERDYYDHNNAKALDPNLPLISLTFVDALKK